MPVDEAVEAPEATGLPPGTDLGEPIFDARQVAMQLFQNMSSEIQAGNLSMDLKPLSGSPDFSSVLARYGRQGEAEIIDPDGQALQEEAARKGTNVSAGKSGRLAWGGYQNGRIPLDKMVAVKGVHYKGEATHYFEPTAGSAFQRMVADAAKAGVTIKLTDSYRTYDSQVALRRDKGGQVATATPGTSVHGWGRAIDVAGDAARKWIQVNGAKYGWVWPSWAQKKGTKSYEPWHFDYEG